MTAHRGGLWTRRPAWPLRSEPKPRGIAGQEAVRGALSRSLRPSEEDIQPYGSVLVRRTVGLVDDSTAVEQLRALADPVRLSIVRELRGGTRCACELARSAGVSSPLLSHHVKVLRTAGLISCRRRGRWIDYMLDEQALKALVALLAAPVPTRDHVTELGCAS